MTSCHTHGMAIDTYSVRVFVVRGQNMKVRHNFTRFKPVKIRKHNVIVI